MDRSIMATVKDIQDTNQQRLINWLWQVALLVEAAKTKWQIVIEKLGNALQLIPLAISTGDGEARPRSAEIEIAGFELIERTDRP